MATTIVSSDCQRAVIKPCLRRTLEDKINLIIDTNIVIISIGVYGNIVIGIIK